MIKKKYSLQTELVASDDGMHTYEIARTWAETDRKGLVLELYPTISADRCGELDISTMHLLNHVKDFGWGTMRIVNLYSTIFEGKPLTGQLSYDKENIAYIEGILESEDIGDYDIVIATGNSLRTHINTVEVKLDIFNILQNKKLEGQVKQIVPENCAEGMSQGTHPLFLGLHYGKEKWTLADYDISSAVSALNEYLETKAEKKVKKVKGKKSTKKSKTEKAVEKSESEKMAEEQKEGWDLEKREAKKDVLSDKK